MRPAKYLVALADLDPDREKLYLSQALAADPRNLTALIRLSLEAEFRGDSTTADRYLMSALAYHHSFQSYMVAASAAARRKDRPAVARYTQLALQFCPGDADGVYMQWIDLADAEAMLAQAGPARQADYLRFLIGQDRLSEAIRYEATLGADDSTDRVRLHLSDRLLLAGRLDEAAAVFTRLHPDFRESGAYNTRFENAPSSLAFDWRLAAQEIAVTHWRPGELAVEIGDHANPVEVAALFVAARRADKPRVAPFWTGDTRGLTWEVSETAPGWRRVVLTVPAGGQRKFQLAEVRFE